MTATLKYDRLRLCDQRKHTGDYYFIIKMTYMSSVNMSLVLRGTEKVF
jgi:hypothetical protein